MGLFSKVECLLCGVETSVIGRFKLNNGSFICGECLSKLNLSDGYSASILKDSSVDEIKKRLEFTAFEKEENYKRIANFKPSTKIENYIWFDDDNKWFVLPKGIFSAKIDQSHVFKYNEILDFEVLEDGTSVTKGGLGKALIGGAVFGLVGAIAGGTSKKTKQICTNMTIKITTRNFDTPVIYLNLINSEVKKDGFLYKQVSRTVQNILSKFQIIIDSLEIEKNVIKNDSISQPLSVADEIKKFKELLDIGAISQEEFDLKKKELLNF